MGAGAVVVAAIVVEPVVLSLSVGDGMLMLLFVVNELLLGKGIVMNLKSHGGHGEV